MTMCPVESVPSFREWLKSNLGMKTLSDREIFNFVISGTAYIVANWRERPWIPIAMKALPPKMQVTFGTPDLSFLQGIQKKLENGNIPFESSESELSFYLEGYLFSVQYTPNFSSDIPRKLKIPLSVEEK